MGQFLLKGCRYIKKQVKRCRKEIRLTEEELHEIQGRAEQMGIKVSQYLRQIISNRPRDDPHIRQELIRLNNEINHIGVNINQIVHNNNSKLYIQEDKHRLYVLMKRLRDLIQEVINKL